MTARRKADPEGRVRDAEPITYRLEIPGWRPALLNELKGHWAKAGRLKANDMRQIATAMLVYGVPVAKGRRRVTLEITSNFRRLPDDDAPLKSLLDGLKRAGAIVDDSRQWCEWSRPEYRRGPTMTVITLEEMP